MSKVRVHSCNPPACACSPNNIEMLAQLQTVLCLIVSMSYWKAMYTDRPRLAPPSSASSRSSQRISSRWISMQSYLSSWRAKVRSRWSFTSTQLNYSLATMWASLCIVLRAQKQPIAGQQHYGRRQWPINIQWFTSCYCRHIRVNLRAGPSQLERCSHTPSS